GERRYQGAPLQRYLVGCRNRARSAVARAPAGRCHGAVGTRLEVGRKGLAIRTLYVGACFAALLTFAAPGQAASRPIDVPAGTVGQAAFAIGRQAGVSISIPDRTILNRHSPAIRG